MSYKTILKLSAGGGVFLFLLFTFLLGPLFNDTGTGTIKDFAIIGLFFGAVGMVFGFLMLALANYIMQWISGVTSRRTKFIIYVLMAVVTYAILESVRYFQYH